MIPKFLENNDSFTADQKFRASYRQYKKLERMAWDNYFFSLEHPNITIIMRLFYLFFVLCILGLIMWCFYFLLMFFFYVIVGFFKSFSLANDLLRSFFMDIYTFIFLSIKGTLSSIKRCFHKVYTKKKFKQWQAKIFKNLPEELKRKIKKLKKKKNK